MSVITSETYLFNIDFDWNTRWYGTAMASSYEKVKGYKTFEELRNAFLTKFHTIFKNRLTALDRLKVYKKITTITITNDGESYSYSLELINDPKYAADVSRRMRRLIGMFDLLLLDNRENLCFYSIISKDINSSNILMSRTMFRKLEENIRNTVIRAVTMEEEEKKVHAFLFSHDMAAIRTEYPGNAVRGLVMATFDRDVTMQIRLATDSKVYILPE